MTLTFELSVPKHRSHAVASQPLCQVWWSSWICC